MTKPIWNGNASATRWAAPASFSVGFPTDGDAVTGTPPTHPGGTWFQNQIAEMRAVIEAAGLVFDPTDTTQFLAAIQALVLQ